MNQIHQIKAGLISLLVILLGGCHPPGSYDTTDLPTPQPAEIRSGRYQRIDLPEVQMEPIAQGLIQLDIDRGNQQVRFEMADGSQVNATIPVGDGSTWGMGCPTNTGATRMEILYLQEEVLVLDGEVFELPILVANCPASPAVIVLRQVSASLGDLLPALACNWWDGEKCIYFGMDTVTLRGQVLDGKTGETILDAEVLVSSPAGTFTFNPPYQIDLTSGGVVDFTIQAPGYQESTGSIEITGSLLIFRNRKGPLAEERPKAYPLPDSGLPFEWDFLLFQE
jgi:hypothetical protein